MGAMRARSADGSRRAATETEKSASELRERERERERESERERERERCLEDDGRPCHSTYFQPEYLPHNTPMQFERLRRKRLAKKQVQRVVNKQRVLVWKLMNKR